MKPEQDEVTLYHYWRSSSSWRVRCALEFKKIQARMIAVDLLNGENEAPDHAKRHPMGYVPVLDIAGHRLVQSVAILEFLDEYIPSPSLYLGNIYDRAQVRALVEIINADTQPIQNLDVMERHSSDPEEKKKWNHYFIHRGLKAFEKLCSTSAGKFSVGDHVCASDLLLIPQCYNALRFEVDLKDFPHISKIHSLCMTLLEFKNSSPERFQP